MKNVQALPPKMTLQYAERARRGDYEFKIGKDIFIWFVGNQQVCVIGLNVPTGHIKKMSAKEVEMEKRSLSQSKEVSRV